MEYQLIECNNAFQEFEKLGLKSGAIHLKCKYEEIFSLNGRMYREGGPARILYHHYFYNTIVYKSYFRIDGSLHNDNGPAKIWYDRKNITLKEYWLYGKFLFEEQYHQQIQTKLYW